MNIKRFFMAAIAAFVFVYLYEYVFHVYFMTNMYSSTAELWRPRSDMATYFPWLLLGQALFAFMFTYIFTKGRESGKIKEGLSYGFLMGILFAAPNLMMYAVQPFPGMMVVSWTISGILELMLAGLIVAAIYKK